MGQFNSRSIRLLSLLGVSFVVLILFNYRELSSGDRYLGASLRHVIDGASERPAAPGPPPSETHGGSLLSTVTEAQQTTHPLSTSNDDTGILVNATAYVKAIMDPEDTIFDRFPCPQLDTKRYEHLKSNSTKPSYFFALDIRQRADLLPRLMGSVVETIRFLGAHKSVLSVVEGHSTDGSFEVLKLLAPELEGLGVEYHFLRSEIDPSAGDRIGSLAELRNVALRPLTSSPPSFDHETTVIFLNDVAICPEDILELAHQRRHLGADMTCGMDWTYVGPTFYDVWVARTIAGDSFSEIPPDGNWNSALNLFWNAPADREALGQHRPFQAFSCWNWAAAFRAEPLWEDGVRFMKSREGECYQGEPQLFCKDLWYAGHGKVPVVPSVNLEYDDEHARKIKGLKGYTSQWTAEENRSVIEWAERPPEKVKCMASYGNQEWRPWDETLPGREG
ncbi:hypothetical protein VUR80DRAFT_1293 [Thermomyces stellatus]